LIGSLRFWAGATARGLGHEVPEAAGGSFPEIKSAADAEAKLDPVTFLFGCTGWRKAFNLTIRPVAEEKLLRQVTGDEAHVTASRHGWHLKPGFFHDWSTSVAADFDFRPALAGPKRNRCAEWLEHLWLGADWLFTLGANQGWGYGWVKLYQGATPQENSSLEEADPPNDGESGDQGATPQENSSLEEGRRFNDPAFLQDSLLPDLADFVFAEYKFEDKIAVELKPLTSANSFFAPRKELVWTGETVGLPIPIGLSLRYALRFGMGSFSKPFGGTAGDAWDKFFFGGAQRDIPAGRFNCSMVFKTDSNGNPSPNGTQHRFRLWAWFPKGYFRTPGLPAGTPTDWCDAANRLRTALNDPSLWSAILNSGGNPTAVYFWPLDPGSLTTGAVNSVLYKSLNKIADRAKKILGRTCVP
jgi:hypothetical protein